MKLSSDFASLLHAERSEPVGRCAHCFTWMSKFDLAVFSLHFVAAFTCVLQFEVPFLTIALQTFCDRFPKSRLPVVSIVKRTELPTVAGFAHSAKLLNSPARAAAA